MTCLEKAMKDLIQDCCPSGYSKGANDVDRKTSEENENGDIIGCRGISCEECWNQQAKEV